MNKIVREHYPASKLPDDLRFDLPADASVTVTVVEERKHPVSKERFLADLWQFERGRGVTGAEAVARVRELRDEWDD